MLKGQVLMTLMDTQVYLLNMTGNAYNVWKQLLLLLRRVFRLYGHPVYLLFSTPLLSLVNIIYPALYLTVIRS